MKLEVGHTFLARLGKTRLRPGGKTATEWLIHKANPSQDMTVLEIACNQGTSAISLAKRFNVKVIACDLDEVVLEKARINAERAGVSHLIEFVHADARQMPFEDSSFDIVINEAMLTMLSDEDKKLALSEYYRLVKKNGYVLTHDVLLRSDSEETNEAVRRELTRAIYVNVRPHTDTQWVSIFKSFGFNTVEYITGDMSLMDPIGMIRDEGFINTTKIVRNALRKENRAQFKNMFRTFKRNQKSLGYIAIASKK